MITPQRCRLASLGAAGITTVLGLLVLLGWYLGILPVVQPLVENSPMQVNTALLFAVCGIGLAGLNYGRLKTPLICGGIAAALGTVTLAQYIFGLELGIDNLLLRQATTGGVQPGRMAPGAAISFLILGAALVWLALRPVRGVTIAGSAGSMVAALGAVSLGGYLAGLPTYAWGQNTQIAVHTAAGLLAAGAGVAFFAAGNGAGRRFGWLPVFSALATLTATFSISLALYQKDLQHVQTVTDLIHQSIQDPVVARKTVQAVQPREMSGVDQAAIIIGLLITGLLTAATALAQDSRRRAEALVAANFGLERMIIERKRAQEALERFFRMSIEPFCMISLEGSFRRVNPAFCRVLGCSEEELTSGHVLDRVHPADRPAAQAQLEKALAGGNIEQFELRMQAKGGSYRWLLWSATPVLDHGVIYGSAYDITERKAVEQSREAHADALARSNAELERFAYVASHDLQEPLRMVASYLQLIERKYKGKLDEKADRWIGFAVGGAVRMQQLISDLLAYSRVQTRATELTCVDSAALVTAALANLEMSLQEANAQVEVGQLPLVKADPTQLTQVFQNLIGNAIKFRGTGSPHIRIAGWHEGGNFVFSVADNGIGIEPQYHERIFEVFQRLHTAAEYPGTGIGLAICRKVVERHGGRMWVESKKGEGSTFLFELAQLECDVCDKNEHCELVRNAALRPPARPEDAGKAEADSVATLA